MKINNNCGRRILIEVEKLTFGETITIAALSEKMPEFSLEDILNVATMFNREHLIVTDRASYDDNDLFRDNKIRGLTERGYHSLDLVRDDKTWNYLKEKMPDFDEVSLYTIFDIANKIKNDEYNKIFDIQDASASRRYIW